MQAKDVTKRLGINRDRIKYLKRQGVFEPEITVPESVTAEYTEQDIVVLKQLIVLTKTGLTCGDIKKIQEGTWTLETALVKRTRTIEEEIRRMNGSLLLAEDLLKNKVEYVTLPTDYYWNVVHQKEEDGEEFLDVDYMDEAISFLREIACPYCKAPQELDLEDYLWDETSNPDESDNCMGPDMVYSFDSEENYHCDCCGELFRIEGWIREYPMGAYDSEDVNVEVIEET